MPACSAHVGHVGHLLVLSVFVILILPGSTQLHAKEDTLKKIVLSKEVGRTFYRAYSSALTKGLSSLANVTYDSSCWRDIAALFNNTKKLIRYLDAAGKPNSGVLQGNVFWIGSFSECQDMSDAKYCTSTLSILALAALGSPPIYWGSCFPKSCNNTEVNQIVDMLIQKVMSITAGRIEIKQKGTLCPGKAQYSTGVKATLVICGFLLLFCLIGTLLDLVDEAFGGKNLSTNTVPSTSVEQNGQDWSDHAFKKYTTESTPDVDADDVILLPRQPSKLQHTLFKLKDFCVDFFRCFSLLRTTKKIFDTNVSSTAITSLNGIRVISMSWVILGHTYLIFLGSPFATNRADMILKDSKQLSIMAVIHGEYSVDSFFFLSGLLVAYTCFRKLKKGNGKLNWFLFYVHRFWRLTPSYMFVILFSVELKRFLADGPYWYTQYKDPVCSKYWWTNLLYVNNFYPNSMNKTCIPWTWYLANDMQFYVITPFLLVPLFKLGWYGVVLPLGLLLESTVLIAFIIGHYELDPLGMLKVYKWIDPHQVKKLGKFQTYVYNKPYCRIQPYLVGFLFGYFMYRYTAGRKRPGWIITLLGWSVAAVVAMLLVYGPHDSVLPGAKEWNTAENVLFGASERLIWALVLVWVTYACHYGCGGLVQKFLSAKFWIPLSRLTYSVYLVHFIVLILMFYGAEGTIHYDRYTVIYYFLSSVVLSYGAGFILAVVIEFPCDNLENLAHKYFNRIRRK